MTTRQIENRIKKLKAIESQIEALTAQAEALKAELKNDMEQKGIDEVATPNYTMRWKEIVSNRLDNKALTAALPEIAALYTKKTVSKRFTVVTA